jgi:VWFA-related protein
MTHRGRVVALIAASSALVAIAASPITSQGQPPPPQPPPPTFRTEANYVRVDVYPTDRNGAPVSDLAQEDFEILENGVPQKIEQFERVLIRGNLPQEMRREPDSVEAGRQAAQNPRARVFVVFLDVNHVSIESSHHIRQPLIDALNRLIGPDDVFAVMTPEMSARDITFARRTTTIEGFLTRYWTWGERNQISKDPVEDQYRVCYPGLGPSEQCHDDDRGIADEMIERRREKHSLDALSDLVRYLRGVREERKGILVVTEGWRLFGPDQTLARQLGCRVPKTTVGVDPRTGRLTADAAVPGLGTSMLKCEADRQALAHINDEQDFRALLDEANGANASFYPIDPRGLAVFDEPISKPTTGLPRPGSTTIVPPAIDQARLRGRHESLRVLALNTDGLAIVDSNDLNNGLRRVVDDLSSYYLLGYYSTGKLDGRFHPITVRVKRSGVQVRARRGYLAATPAAVTASARAAAAPAVVSVEAAAIQAALAPLAGAQRDTPLRVHVAAGWRAVDTIARPGFWVVAEFSATTPPPGRDVDVTVISASGAAVGHATGTGAGRSVLVPVLLSEPPPSGEFTVRVRAEGFGTGTVQVTLPNSPEPSGAIVMRRGPTTGNRDAPTADLRFRRNERIRVDIPTAESAPVTARLLDRTGTAMSIPLTASVRDDANGSRWRTSELALAPLAPGDYLIELAAGERRTLIAFRVVP